MNWNTSTSLNEMQNDLKTFFEKNMRLKTKLCDILTLSYDDYHLLRNKLFQITQSIDFGHYALAILVCWVTSYKYNDEDTFFNIMRAHLNNTPQHHSRYLLDAITDMTYDYQIDIFDCKLQTVQHLKAIVEIHAGVGK